MRGRDCPTGRAKNLCTQISYFKIKIEIEDKLSIFIDQTNKVTVSVYSFYKENKILWFFPSIRIRFKSLRDLILTNGIDPPLLDGARSNSSFWKTARTWTTISLRSSCSSEILQFFREILERLWFCKIFFFSLKITKLSNNLQELSIYSASLISVREF